jgi:hypothetical protein
MMKEIRREFSRSGFSLALTFIVTFLLLLIITSLVLQLTFHSRSTLANFNSLAAFNLARSGITKASFEVQADPLWATTAPFILSEENGNCEIRVTVPAGGTSPIKYWKVSSTGRSRGSARILTAWLEKKSSLEFLSWSDNEFSDTYGEAWISEGEFFAGPMHTNGYFSFRGKPRFGSPLTSSNTGDPFYKAGEGLYVQGGKSSSDNRTFYHCAVSYARDMPIASSNNAPFSFQGATNPAPFPAFDPDWQNRATLVIEGTADQMLFSTKGTVEITQGLVTKSYSCQDATIFVKGGIKSLQGTIKGNVIVMAQNDITITGNTTYQVRTKDSIALISGENIVLDTGNSKNARINAYLAAMGGSLLVKDFDRGSPRGSLTLYGGILQKYASPSHTCTTGTSELKSGFLRTFVYDTRCQSLPSWFPHADYLRVSAFKDDRAPSW